MKLYQSLIAIAMFGIFMSSCSKDDVTEENSNELITTVELKFTERGTSNVQSFNFEDIDGPGGQAPEIDQIILAPNKIYDVEIEVYDDSKNPPLVIHEEIEEESNDHRFYFEPSNANLTINGLDNDGSGKPLGLKSVWTTTGAAQGNVKITLRHYENGGKETSDPVNSTKSSTDAEVSFVFRIQE